MADGVFMAGNRPPGACRINASDFMRHFWALRIPGSTLSTGPSLPSFLLKLKIALRIFDISTQSRLYWHSSYSVDSPFRTRHRSHDNCPDTLNMVYNASIVSAHHEARLQPSSASLGPKTPKTLSQKDHYPVHHRTAPPLPLN